MPRTLEPETHLPRPLSGNPSDVHRRRTTDCAVISQALLVCVIFSGIPPFVKPRTLKSKDSVWFIQRYLE